jgi:hypothetical protein
MPNAILEDHIVRTKAFDKDSILGFLTWYTVSGVNISHSDMLKGLTAVGLQAHVPRYPLDYDVFRRVSSKAGLKKIPTTHPDITEDYLIREVGGRNEDIAVRRIVVETRNQAGKRLDYQQLRDIEFDKKAGTISVTDLRSGSNPQVDAITQDICAEYAAWKGKLNSYGVREFVRKFILKQGGTLVRDGGGVYFLMEAQADALDALETFVNDLSPATTLHSLPLVDDLKQRQMVRKAFEAETVGSVDGMIMQITDLKREGKPISGKKFAKILTEYQDLAKKTQGYEELLETTMGDTKSRLRLFQASVMSLQGLVKS